MPVLPSPPTRRRHRTREHIATGAAAASLVVYVVSLSVALVADRSGGPGLAQLSWLGLLLGWLHLLALLLAPFVFVLVLTRQARDRHRVLPVLLAVAALVVGLVAESHRWVRPQSDFSGAYDYCPRVFEPVDTVGLPAKLLTECGPIREARERQIQREAALSLALLGAGGLLGWTSSRVRLRERAASAR